MPEMGTILIDCTTDVTYSPSNQMNIRQSIDATRDIDTRLQKL